MTRLGRLTVRVWPAADVKGAWLASVQNVDGQPLAHGRNYWLTQGGSPADAVESAANLCKFLTGECKRPGDKHRFRRSVSNLCIGPGSPSVKGWRCTRCRLWVERKEELAE